MLNASSRIVRSGDPLFAELDGETVMLDPDQGMYFALGATGSRIWALIEQPTVVSDLCSTLTTEFEVDSATCLDEALEFLDELRQAGLVEVQP